MSPIAQLLYELRTQHGLCQDELSELMGYNQTYLSALETGTKGPPTTEFVDKLMEVFELPLSDQEKVRQAFLASDRKLTITRHAPTEVFLLLNDLKRYLPDIGPAQVRLIRAVLAIEEASTNEGQITTRHSIKRRDAKNTSKRDIRHG